MISDIGDDPRVVSRLVIDFIERSLPQLIAELEIPPPMSSEQRGLLQLRLAGKGFRPVAEKRRQELMQEFDTEGVRQLFRGVRAKAATSESHFLSGQQTTLSLVASSSSDWQTLLVPSQAAMTVTLEGKEPESHGIKIAPQIDLPDVDVLMPFPGGTFSQERKEPVGLDLETVELERPEPLAGTDIRGKLAVVEEDQLRGFLSGALRQVVQRTPKVIEVPDRALYSALNYSSIISEYKTAASKLTSAEADPKLPAEIRLLDSLLDALSLEEQWENINQRRFHLIVKRHTRGLSVEEDSELGELQELARRRSKSVAPLPFAELARLESYVRRALSSKEKERKDE